jgi:DNA-binding LacI/PurR family transcriptional regulator
MRDVALRAGVTAATVSLSLRGSPLITSATRAKVLEAAHALGYQPNPLVRALMRSRRRRGAAPGGPTLGFITGFPSRHGWRRIPTPVFQQMFTGARTRAKQCGYELQEFWLYEKGMSPRRFSNMMHARGVLGLVVAPMPEANSTIELDWSSFATVALGTTLTQPALHRIATDLFHSMMVAMEECLRLGYRRIGLVMRKTVNQKVERRWLAAYLLMQNERPDLAPLKPLLTELSTEEASFRAWFRQEKPDVVIAPSPYDLQRWLKAWGLRIPDDVGVASLSTPRVGDPLSGICQNSELIGMRSIDMLATLLERNELGVPGVADTMLVAGTWNPGRTVKAQKGAAPRPDL